MKNETATSTHLRNPTGPALYPWLRISLAAIKKTTTKKTVLHLIRILEKWKQTLVTQPIPPPIFSTNNDLWQFMAEIIVLFINLGIYINIWIKEIRKNFGRGCRDYSKLFGLLWWQWPDQICILEKALDTVVTSLPLPGDQEGACISCPQTLLYWTT